MKRVPHHQFLYLRGRTYIFRRAVPPEAREAFGGKLERVRSLNTSNLPEARLRLGEHLKEFERVLSKATGRPDPTLTVSPPALEPGREQIDAAVRAWVKDRMDNRPVATGDARARLADLRQQAVVPLTGYEAGAGRANLQTRWIAEAIRDKHGWSLPEGSPGFDHLLRLVARGQVEAAGQEADEITNRPRVARDLTFSPEEYRLDAVREAEARANEPVPLMGLFNAYVAEAKPAPASVKAATGHMTKFIDFLGHDDAGKVTAVDVISFKDRLVTEPLKDGSTRSAKTINDGYLSSLKTIFRWAVRNRRIAANPAADVRARGPKRVVLRKKGLTDAEALLILKSALSPASSRTSPEYARARRWVPWICAYTGARVNEITQLRAEDVLKVEGVWCIRITPEAGSVKTGQARTVPLHPHLIEQGILEIAHGKVGPLFYKPSRHRGGSAGNPQAKKAGERLAKWVRELGVDDPAVAPNHGWRHRFKTEARRVRMDHEARDAIQGHSPRTEGEGYGDVPVSVMVTEIKKLPPYRVPGTMLPPARKRAKRAA